MRRLLILPAVGSLLLLLVLFTGATVLRLTEIRSESYDSYALAETAGLFQRGWAPSFVPRSAKALAITYDLDTNLLCTHVHFDPADGPELLVALEEAGYAAHTGELPALPEPPAPRPCPFRLGDAAAGDIVLGAGGETFDSYAALDTSQGLLYLWTRRSAAAE